MKATTRLHRPLSLAALLALASSQGFAAPGDALIDDSPGVAPAGAQFEAGTNDVALKTGAFQYSVPISVPPGRLDMAPAITLAYSSQGALRGGVAAGWALPFPEIRRDYSDGVTGDERWQSSMQGGHELIAFAEPAISSAATFRGEGDETFTRYRRIDDAGPTWEARTLDGRVYRFGELQFMSGPRDPDRFPLTSVTDPHGNQVSYHWTRHELENGFYSFVPTLIRYSQNDAAGLPHHAEVRLHWAAPTYCFSALLPKAARWDNRNGSRHVDGAHRLTAIETHVRDTPTSAFRLVRTYTLGYDPATESCSAHGAPTRTLASIQESGVARNGAVTTLPAQTFTYGLSEQPPAIPVEMPGLATSLSTGSTAHPTSPPLLSSKTIDLDGDGRVDRLTMLGTGECTALWHRNEGDHFAAPVTVALPQELPWRNGVSAQLAYHELCSLAGQESALETPGLYQPPGQRCKHISAWVAFRWLDVTGDGLPDLVTALNYYPYWYDPAQGATPTSAPPTQSGPDCDEGAPARDWQQQGDLFPWRIYRNLGNGQFATQPLQRTVPIALDGEGNDGFIAKKEKNLTLSSRALDYGVLDLDGDGHVDLLQATPGAWLVHRGTAASEWLPAIEWPAPAGAVLSASTTTWPSPQWSHTDVQQTLEDINGDGLPDLLRTNASGIVAHFNTGSSFETTARLVALLPFDREPGRSVIQALQGTSGNLQHGRRYGVHRFIDLDGDGLPEFIRNQGGHDLTPSIHPNHGGSFHLGLPGPLVPSPDVLFGRASDNGSWRVEAELMDLTGDGVPDAYDGGQLFTRVPWPAPRHVLRRVQNGRGAELHVKYRSTATIGDLGPARRGAAVWVVEEVTRISGAPSSTTSVVRYAYQGPLANADRRGRTAFRGFQTVTVTKDSGAATEHHFTYFLDAAGHGNLLWEGAIAEERVLEAGGFVAEQTTYEYTPLWLDSVHHAVVSSAVARQVIVPGSGPGQGADSPVVRTVSDWQPLTSGVAPNPLVAFRNATTVVSVLDPGPAPLVVPSRRTRTAGRLRYGPGEYLFLTTDELAEEELAPGSWQLATRTRLAYTNALPVLRRHLVDAGVEAIVRNVFHPSGVIYETSRPRHTAAGSGLVVRTEYDAFQLYPIATIDELGGRVLRQFDPATGALEVESSRTVATVLANAPRAETRHDGLGRPISRLRSHDDGTAITLVELERTQYTDGPESRIRVDQRLSFGADEWVVSEAFHDGWGRVVRQVEHTVRGPESTEYHYDAMGQLVSIVTLDVSQDDQSTASFKYTYDSLGRVVMRSTPEAAPLRTAYWGHVVEEWVDTTDGSLGRRVRYESDPAGRLRRVIERTATGEAVTAYEYDANDRVTAITNPDGALTRMFHDHGGRRVRVERGARTWRFQYDLHGNLEAELGPVLPGGDPLDHLNTYTYDELDRLITSRPGLGGLAAATPNAIASHGPTTFTYDQGCTGSNGFGRKCIVALPFGELRYGYTVEGWLETEQRSLSIPVDGATIQLAEQVAYGHDPDGEPNRVTYADGGGNSWRMEYTDNADGVPLAVAAGPVGAPSVTLATLTRGRGNVVRRRQGPVDQEQTWTYDSMGRVLGTRIVGASGVVVEQVADYWQTGNLRSLDTSSLDEPLDFQYDPQYQLVGVDSDGTNYLAAFTYSPAGRVMRAMVSSTLTGAQVVSRDVAYDYAGADEPVTALRRIADGSALAHMAHDAAGNTTVRLAEGDKSYFHYDALDRLRDADSSGSREIYLYSPDGDRIATLRKDGAWTVRHWFGPAETLYSPAGAVLDGTLHVGLGAGTVARLNRAPDSKPELVYADGLGNTLALLDLKGNTTALFAYGAFGETLLASGPSADGYHRRFNGEEWDEATGLIYYGFRFYDPLLLQWTQPDPMFRVSPDQDLRSPRLAGLYDFSLNNPLRYVDPDGLQPFSAAMAEMQREMCTDATQHPVLCPKEPSAFIHETWTDKYGDDEEEPAEDDDQGAEQAEGGKSFIGSAISFAIDVFVPQSATDVAMTASGAGVVTFLSKAAKVATKRKAVTKATKAGKGGKASAKAAKRTPTRYEYHHLTPQAFREELRLVAGVDVHDYTMRISRTLHIKLHSKRRMARLGKLDWNSAWKQEMRSGRLTSPEAVDRFVKKMVRDYGLPKNAIVRYPRAPRKQQ